VFLCRGDDEVVQRDWVVFGEESSPPERQLAVRLVSSPQ